MFDEDAVHSGSDFITRGEDMTISSTVVGAIASPVSDDITIRLNHKF